ncbi:hypothetical protein RAS2_07100 [Phycisphaerae bacterium RAS2]|nr:hypothetical protein RAS2_07100 [Phycisphaerae bacterium RAS2]
MERYAYDGYGRPYIREAVGRGEMDNNSEMDDVDSERVKDAKNGTIWDPRADLDDDGDSDTDDEDLFDLKLPSWSTREAGPLATVSQAFSDVDNRYAFQGVPHFVMDTLANATAANAKLPLGHHRARLVDVMTGRWNTNDPLYKNPPVLTMPENTMYISILVLTIRRAEDHKKPNDYLHADSRPTVIVDPSGLCGTCICPINWDAGERLHGNTNHCAFQGPSGTCQSLSCEVIININEGNAWTLRHCVWRIFE